MLEADWLIRQWEEGIYHSLLVCATWIMEDKYHVI